MSNQDTSKPTIGQIHPIEITGYSHQGLGVGRIDGQVVFVHSAIRGERLRVRLTERKKGILYAEIVEIIQPSPARQRVACPGYHDCGGCSLQHMDYPAQLELKMSIVENSLHRLAGLEALPILPIIGMDEPWHYRNKGVFRVLERGGRYSFGFRAEGSHRVSAHRCTHLFPPLTGRLLDELEEQLSSEHRAIGGLLTQLLIRTSRGGAEAMLILMGAPDLAARRAELDELFTTLCAALPELKVYGISIDRGEINPLYGNLELYSAEQALTEELGGCRYKLSPASFFQVNTVQAGKLIELLRSRLAAATANNCYLIDAYSGIGTLGLALAGSATEVACIELVPQAVTDAKVNAELNGLTNVECHLGRAEQLFRRVSRRMQSSADRNEALPQVVIIDPPRKGCQPELLSGILEWSPDIVIYISCNPATLARDLKTLTAGGYEVQSVQPLDFFPQTWHCEVCVELRRKN